MQIMEPFFYRIFEEEGCFNLSGTCIPRAKVIRRSIEATRKGLALPLLSSISNA